MSRPKAYFTSNLSRVPPLALIGFSGWAIYAPGLV